MEMSPDSRTTTISSWPSGLAQQKQMPSAYDWQTDDSAPFDPAEVTEVAPAPVWETALNYFMTIFLGGLALIIVLRLVASAVPWQDLLKMGH